MKSLSLIILTSIVLFSCNSNNEDDQKFSAIEQVNYELEIIPVHKASLVLKYGDNIIYVDPTGGAKNYQSYPDPTIVLITDSKRDHYDIKTLTSLNLENAKIVAPEVVVDKFVARYNNMFHKTLDNGELVTIKGIAIEAVPMRNVNDEDLKFNNRYNGNGYVVTLGNERIYISGDSEDIPEIKALENIDRAFIAMNLPLSETVENAASAVLGFKPKSVYPYYYKKGAQSVEDINLFKSIIEEKNKSIDIVQLE